ncbi:hypothetical protein [Arthrobacter cavernae]|uniref:DUF732 domain-containing protein n=1 Tax=Arthrobacter cavernae TaxID=2817681 RepID=A0A939HFL4_9MICC|nr:hypothetical protein [Arthrobacter cavernae]MBO1266615.1 hypothetical protein [Arthrobacter cavernae]
MNRTAAALTIAGLLAVAGCAVPPESDRATGTAPSQQPTPEAEVGAEPATRPSGEQAAEMTAQEVCLAWRDGIKAASNPATATEEDSRRMVSATGAAPEEIRREASEALQVVLYRAVAGNPAQVQDGEVQILEALHRACAKTGVEIYR